MTTSKLNSTGIYSLYFELDFLPKLQSVSAWNSWYKRRDYVSASKRQVAWKVYNLRPDKPLESVKIVCTRYSSGREPDYDNLAISFKHIIDGLVEAKIILDDKSSVVKIREYKFQKCAPKKGKISVLVEEIKEQIPGQMDQGCAYQHESKS